MDEHTKNRLMEICSRKTVILISLTDEESEKVRDISCYIGGSESDLFEALCETCDKHPIFKKVVQITAMYLNSEKDYNLFS